MPEVPTQYRFELEHAATGEPISVTGVDRQYVATEDVRVGYEMCTRANGTRYRCAESFEQVDVERTQRVVTVRQGATPIDRLSALAIMNDPAFQERLDRRLAEVAKRHASVPRVYADGMAGTEFRTKLGGGIAASGWLLGFAGAMYAAGDFDSRGTVFYSSAVVSSALILGGIHLYKKARKQQDRTFSQAKTLAEDKIRGSEFVDLTTEAHLTELAARYSGSPRVAPARVPATTPAGARGEPSAPSPSVQPRAWAIGAFVLEDERGKKLLEVDAKGYVIENGRRQSQFTGDQFASRYRFRSNGQGWTVYDGRSSVMTIGVDGRLTGTGFTLIVLPSGIVELEERGSVRRSRSRFRGVTPATRPIAAFVASIWLMKLKFR